MNTPKKLHLSAALNSKGVRFVATSEEDMKAYYKAYQMGSFDVLGAANDLSFDDFKVSFAYYLSANKCTSVTFKITKDGAELPIGVGIIWVRGRIIQNENLIWFPWATPRNILESCINYFDTFRNAKEKISGANYKILEFAMEQDVKFFDKLVQMGILEKVGKISGLYLDKQDCTLYTTKEV